MKKAILTLIVSLFAVISFAQSEHLTFKGVPIDGTLSQFVSSMKAKGFVVTAQQSGVAVLSGDFAGYKDCEIYVQTLQNKDLVSHIGVIFPEMSSWSTLEGNYSKLKNMLTQKYGEPVHCLEAFQRDDIDDDNSKFYELKMNRCYYQSMWELKNGKIGLKLISVDYKCNVMLVYTDKINTEEVEQAAMDDL